MMSLRKWVVLIVSLAMACIATMSVFPTPNNVNGGTVSMCLIIFLSIVFKSVIDFSLGKFIKKKDGERIVK